MNDKIKAVKIDMSNKTKEDCLKLIVDELNKFSYLYECISGDVEQDSSTDEEDLGYYPGLYAEIVLATEGLNFEELEEWYKDGDDYE